jgi:phosphoribosylaminoimidazole-succinocarboxamide synthase
MSVSLVRRGSSKNIYDVVDGCAVARMRFVFTDQVSVFDRGAVPVLFPRLGQYRSGIAGRLFELMEGTAIKTHYLAHRVEEATMDILPFDIPELAQYASRGSHGRILPGEILFRNAVTPKFMKRVQNGSLNREEVERFIVGPQGVLTDARFEPAFVECTTKWEPTDRYVSDEEATTLFGFSQVQLDQLYNDAVRPAVSFLTNLFRSAGFDLLDGKFEVGLTPSGTFMLLDSISPDELRLIGPDGQSHDKDIVRRWYAEYQSDWCERLEWAKLAYPTDKEQWPPYEASPPCEVVETVVENYRRVAEAIDAI